MNKVVKCLIPGLTALILTSCITTYRDFPQDRIDKPPAYKIENTLQYDVLPADVLDMGGHDAIVQVLKDNSIFQNTERVRKDIPMQGLFVQVEAKWVPPTLPALAFVYLSAATLTLFPAWSEKEGFEIFYHLYVNGEKKKTYEYKITRKFAV